MTFITASITLAACLFLGTPIAATVPETPREDTAVDMHQIILRPNAYPADPALVVLHGMDHSSGQFRELIGRLSQRFQLVLPQRTPQRRVIETEKHEVSRAFANVAEAINSEAGYLGHGRVTLPINGFGVPLGLRLATREEDKIVLDAFAQTGPHCSAATGLAKPGQGD